MINKIVNKVRNFPRRFDAIEAGIVDLKMRTDRLEQLQEGIQTSLTRIKNSGVVYLSSKEVMVKIFSGAKMFLDTTDRGLVPHLMMDGEWEHDVTHAWLSVLKPGDTVLDIGANFGYFSVLAAQQTNRDCKIVLFEANPNLIPFLDRTMKVNSFDNISAIENLAVSNKKDKIKLNVLRDFIASSSVLDLEAINKSSTHQKYEVEQVFEVDAVTVDAYCRENKIATVDMIKMDIEGYEDIAYEGMRKTIQKSPRATLFIEFTKSSYSDAKKFYNMLLNDFGHVYVINQDGTLSKQQNVDFEQVVKKDADWTMPIFSKRSDLVD